jgi:hypothetical protein
MANTRLGPIHISVCVCDRERGIGASMVKNYWNMAHTVHSYTSHNMNDVREVQVAVRSDCCQAIETTAQEMNSAVGSCHTTLTK